MKITQIAYGRRVTASKVKRLTHIAALLGTVRATVWHQFGATQSKNFKSFRDIRDRWVNDHTFAHIPARLRNETLRDTFQDILAYKAAALVKVHQAINKRYKDKKELKAFQANLRKGYQKAVSYQHRLVRKYFKHGQTKVNKQIILDTTSYTAFTRKGQAWISVMSLERNRRICIPLNTSKVPTGTLRLIIRDRVEVHYTIESDVQCNHAPCGDSTIGVDKGYSEVYATSEGERLGLGLGNTLSSESDLLKVKYQRRNKIKAVQEKHLKKKKHKKAQRIQKNNMGRKKLNKRKQNHTLRVRHLVHNATHRLFDKAGTVICEDLSWAGAAKARSKTMRRRLSGWVKGLINQSLEEISKRRSAFVIHVNAAYTSQVHSPCGAFGERSGDALYCNHCKVVCDSDMNAAINILERSKDPEISLYTKFTQVKEILKNRYSERLRLSSPDSSCVAQATSTESELPEIVNLC